MSISPHFFYMLGKVLFSIFALTFVWELLSQLMSNRSNKLTQEVPPVSVEEPDLFRSLQRLNEPIEEQSSPLAVEEPKVQQIEEVPVVKEVEKQEVVQPKKKREISIDFDISEEEKS